LVTLCEQVYNITYLRLLSTKRLLPHERNDITDKFVACHSLLSGS